MAVLVSAGSIGAACKLRCPSDGGSVIVCDGDSKFDAIDKCGAPDYIDEVGFVSSGVSRYGPILNAPGYAGSYRQVYRKIEQWYYNCGEGRFIKVLTFKGNELVEIEAEGRGSGPKRCW